MTRLVNRPPAFAEEALAGYAAAEPDRVRAVHGGVVRAAPPRPGTVAIVLGGGSGHFPAFAGWVGPGMGAGAACGNVFASPSEGQILSVARAADAGGGILLLPINYAGDILNFGAAAETLRAEGVEVRTVAVTDDVAAAPAEARHLRRGVAGAFLVVKAAGAAAERGASLEELERTARAANEATRTFGVAFSGCTLPGADAPLFTLPPGRIGVGMGIHGEPGLFETDLGSADDVADLLVDELFRERAPERGRRVAVLVNGLGATKQDELFLVFARVRRRLEQEGMVAVAPVVGEQVTSLDMAGLSVSLGYLDDALEAAWLAPADVHSFTRGPAAGPGPVVAEGTTDAAATSAPAPEEPVPLASAASRDAAVVVVAALGRAVAALAGAERELGRLDATAGDGDHGAGMLRGATAARDAAARAAAAGAGAGTTLRRAAREWSERGGGTSGALWGTGLAAAADAIGDEEAPDVRTAARAARAFADAVIARGGAASGDKTMVDALVPFADALGDGIAAGAPLPDAWRDAAARAERAARATAALPARLGRSRVHGDRSIGTPDPGAVSFALLVAAAAG